MVTHTFKYYLRKTIGAVLLIYWSILAIDFFVSFDIFFLYIFKDAFEHPLSKHHIQLCPSAMYALFHMDIKASFLFSFFTCSFCAFFLNFIWQHSARWSILLLPTRRYWLNLREYLKRWLIVPEGDVNGMLCFRNLKHWLLDGCLKLNTTLFDIQFLFSMVQKPVDELKRF